MMKFKSNPFAYYGVISLQLFVPALWMMQLWRIPIRNADDFAGFMISLLAVELLISSCSPVVHRVIVTDENSIAEKWLWLTFNRMEIAEISDIGVCTYMSGNQVRQFAFVSSSPLSDSEIMRFDGIGLFRRKALKGRFIAIDHPQKGLDEWLNSTAEKNGIVCRQCRI